MYVLGGIMSETRVCIGWYHERDSCMYWMVSLAGLVYVLCGIMSGTRVCIGWYHERNSCMYWVVS